MCVVIPWLILFSVFGTDFHGEVSSWWCYLSGILFFCYRMLDEMDGKQARRTGNSSPLGLLFDHGCDSFTTGLMTLGFMKLIQVGNSPIILIGLLATTQSFHFCTLEEYYVGGLFLGVGNGATDGSVIIIGLLFYCGYAGQEFWKTIYSLSIMGDTYNLQASHIFIYGMFISQVFASLYK